MAQITSTKQSKNAINSVSEFFLKKTLDALSSHIAILNEIGEIIAVNNAWEKFVDENGYTGKEYGIGSKYVSSCSLTVGIGSNGIKDIQKGIIAVLQNKTEEFHTEYPCHTKKQNRWFLLRATKFIENNKSYIVVSHENITDLKAAEQQNQLNQRKLAFHFDQTPLGVIEFDTKFRITNWNPAAEKIFGYTNEDVLGKHIAGILFPKKYKKLIDKAGMEFLQNKKGTTSSAECMTKNGGSVTCEFFSTPLIDSMGEIIGAAALLQDITDRKKTEERLFQLASIVESSDAGIVSLSLDGNVESWNKGAEKLYGYKAKDIIGKSYTHYVPEDKQKEMQGILKKIKKGEHIEPFETARVCNDGRRIEIFLTISPRFDIEGKIIGTSNIGRDITKRIKAENALKESEERYRSVITSLHEGIVVQNNEGMIQACNKSACTILGLSEDELLGRKSIDQQWYTIHEDGTPYQANEQPGIVTLKTGKPQSNVIMGVHKPDGTIAWISINSQPLFYNADSTPSAVVTSFFDITAQRASEQTLKDLNMRLQRSNSELQDFASVASHDLQEPLRKIQAFGDRMQIKFGDTLSDEAKDYLSRMQNAASRMQKLINDILVFSRVTTKAQPYNEVDLTRIVQEVLSDLEISIEQKKAKIEVAPLPKIDADEIQMRQLFQNLISNSLKFQKSHAKPVIKIRAKVIDDAAKKACMITVSDNGIGFDTKYLYKIFSVFQRLHSQQEYHGTGVGLAVCRKIAERHGGSITADSTLGKGSTFVITLPIKHDEKHMKNAGDMMSFQNPLGAN